VDLELDLPLFVKPAREGTGMGIDEGSLVHDFDQLQARVAWLVNSYQQPVLVEEFLPGREFTVGFFGNPGSPDQRPNPALYDDSGYHWLPILEIGLSGSVSPTVYGHDAKSIDIGAQGAPDYLCPAEIPAELEAELIELTRKASAALFASDISRVDFRMGADGKPYLLEINTLPGLNPAISDICIMADAEGLAYSDLILEILYLAAARFNLALPEKQLAAEKSTSDQFLQKLFSSKLLNPLAANGKAFINGN
jgi:D-alanine-D-alanine ligase